MIDLKLIKRILSTKKVKFVSPDHFDFGFTKIRATEFDDFVSFKESLSRLCESPDFTTQHLTELLEYLED